jgi:transposase-like protein
MDTNLIKLIEDFRSEDQCRQYLETLRWAEGVECPRCKSHSISQVLERSQYDCNECRYQFSVTSGTVFHDTHLPLWKWFLATYMMCESKKSISANQIKRTLGISYKTAWYLCHRIRTAMRDPEPLNGIIEVDDAFVGGPKPGKRGRGAAGKAGVVGMIERGGKVRLQSISQMDAPTLMHFIENNLGKNVKMVITDCWPAYTGVGKLAKHKKINHAKELASGDTHTNSMENVWSLLKRSLIGAYHKVSTKHLPAYLNEIAFRFGNRENPNLFEDTLKNLLFNTHLSFKQLTA